MSIINPIDFEVAVLVNRRVDGIVPRLNRLIEEVGFVFPPNSEVPQSVVDKLNHRPDSLTAEEWRDLPYSFLPEDKQALIELSLGIEVFGQKAIEALDSVCGDFFKLDGAPRHAIRPQP
ncbi:MAG: hypothetical protein AAGB32_01150 [Pseudomonadota bacterium]